MKIITLLFAFTFGISLVADDIELEAESIDTKFDSAFEKFDAKTFPVKDLKSKDYSKTIKAEILDYDSIKKKVKISKTDGKRIMWFDIDLLAEESREFILNWYTKQQIYRYLFFKAKVLKDLGDNLQTESGIPRRYELEVRNMSSIPMKDIEVYYRIYKKKGESVYRSVGVEGEKQRIAGVFNIEELGPQEKWSFQTNPIFLQYVKVLYTSEGVSSRNKTSRDNLAGIHCRVVYDGANIKDWTFPENLLVEKTENDEPLSQENILENGGFERTLDSWNLQSPRRYGIRRVSATTIEQFENQPELGKGVLCVDPARAKIEYSRVSVGQDVTLPKNVKRIRFSFDVLFIGDNDLEKKVAVRTRFSDFNSEIEILEESNKWYQLSWDFDLLKSGGKDGEIEFDCYAVGKWYFDNISVVPIE